MERPGNDAFAARFETYVCELRVVFAAGGLRFGRPKDVTLIAQALGARGRLHDDTAAVVRSILYREHESLSRAELASIVVVAAGGTDLYGSAQEGDAVQQFESFVNGVHKAVRESALAEDGRKTVEAGSPLLPGAASPMKRQEVSVEPDVDQVKQPIVAPTTREKTSAGLQAQAQTMSGNEAKAATSGEATYFLRAKAEPTVEGTREDAGGASTRRGAPILWRWVAGLGVLVVLIIAGFVWRHQTARVEQSPPEPARSGAAGQASMLPSAAGQALPALPATPTVGATTNNASAGGRTGGGLVISVTPGASTSMPPVGPEAASASASPSLSATPVTTTAPTPTTLPPTATRETPESAVATAHAARPTHTSSGPAASGTTPSVSPAVGGKFVVSSGVMSGHLISAPQPSYPKMAKMWGIEGQVIMQAVISSKGKVVTAKVLDGHTMLRGSATKAVKKWRYRPYLVDGKATDIATVVIVDYKLKP